MQKVSTEVPKSAEESENRETDPARNRTQQTQRLFDTGLVGLLYWTIEGGIVDANDTLLTMLGYTREDLLAGRINWVELTPPELREKDEKPIADLYSTGKHLPFEKEYLRKDGTRIPILIASAFNEGSQTEGVGFVVDISAQKRAERQERERSEEILTIFETITDAFYSVDTEWKFTYLNAQAEHLLRRDRQSLVGKNVWEEFPGAHDATFGREYHRAIEENVSVTFEEFYPPLDVWFEVRAFPSPKGGLSVYFRNVSDRRRAEQEREAERDAMLARQRLFMRDMVFSLTEGRFCLCLTEEDLSPPLKPMTEAIELTAATLRLLRREVNDVTRTLGFVKGRSQDIETGVGEAAMNAVTHGGGGKGWVCADFERGIVQVWIQDFGTGISEEALPHVLEKGMSTTGTLGHGFWLMLQTCDRVYLFTSPGGTTIVLEKDRDTMEPAWLKSVNV